MAVRVRGRRPYDRSDRRPHFKIAVGRGPKSPLTLEGMHLACHIHPQENFFFQNGRRHAQQSDGLQQQGCFETVSRCPLALARSRP